MQSKEKNIKEQNEEINKTNSKKIIYNLLKTLPDNLKLILFQMTLLDRKTALTAIKNDNLKLIEYMSNRKYKKMIVILSQIAKDLDFKVGFQTSSNRIENYLFQDEIYYKHLVKVFDLKNDYTKQFNEYVEKLISFEKNNLKNKLRYQDYLKIALSLNIEEDVKEIYFSKIKWLNNLAEVGILEKRYELIMQNLKKCQEKKGISCLENDFKGTSKKDIERSI